MDFSCRYIYFIIYIARFGESMYQADKEFVTVYIRIFLLTCLQGTRAGF